MNMPDTSSFNLTVHTKTNEWKKKFLVSCVGLALESQLFDEY